MPAKLTLNALMKALEASKPAIDPKALPQHLQTVDKAKAQVFGHKPGISANSKPVSQVYDHKLGITSNTSPISKSAYLKGYKDSIVKQAWLFSLPLGGMDVPQFAQIPKYIKDTLHGGSPEDSKRSPARSAGMTGMALMSGLFGLGFAGMGARDMGAKLALLARKAKGLKPVDAAEKLLNHKMEVPAYKRFADGMAGSVPDKGPMSVLKTPARYTGAAAGAVAHPFNKLEDYVTQKMVSGLGAHKADNAAALMKSLGSHPLVDNKATQFAGSLWALPLLVAGDSMFSPYHEKEQ